MPLVSLLNITKHFVATTALDSVSVHLSPARVHGLLGENGAGKTTLMNILYGLLRPDSGQIRLDGQAAQIHSPRDAIAAGIGMVHQHFMLAQSMSVLDNVLLGDRRQGQILRRPAAARRLRDLADSISLSIDPNARIDKLSVGTQQRVEILKALFRDVSLLILDEPTAVLTPAETAQLFVAVDRLRSAGKTVVFISHKLAEVKRICDDLTVLRRGRVVWEGPAPTISERELAQHMVGREVQPVALDRSRTEGDTTLYIKGRVPVTVPMLQLHDISAGKLRGVNLEIPAGQIVGVAGVDGNGQEELAQLAVGLLRPDRGQILIAGRDVTRLPMARGHRPDVAHIPTDRKSQGLVLSMSIAENLALKVHTLRTFSHFDLLSWKALESAAQKLMSDFDIRASSPRTPVAMLSGGNQQKVILARELGLGGASLIVAVNPTRGLDVAASQFVYRQLLARRAAGCAVLLINSELDDLLSVCDRIAVLYNGSLQMSDFPAQGIQQIGRMMVGNG